MMRQTRLLALAMFAVIFAIVAVARVAAQDQSHESAASQHQEQTGAGQKHADPQHQLAEASSQAAGHEEGLDSHAEFKYSPSVRYLAEKTGMSVTAAYWVSVLLNFAIVAGVIAYFMRKKMPGEFRTRTSMIQKNLEEARRASEDAHRRLSEIEGRLSRLDSEISSIESNAEVQAKEEEARLRAAVEEERQKIVLSAEQEIASAANNARRELKSYAAELAVALAEKKIKLDAATDAEVLREFVDQLGSDGAPRSNR